MKKIAILLSTLLLAQTSCNSAQAQPDNLTTSRHQLAQANDNEFSLSPQQVQQTAKNITVRVTSASSGGSGVLIAKKGNTYLVLTNAHVARRATQFQIQAPDGQKYTAKPIDGGFDPKYDLALLQFTSQKQYTLADLSDVGSPLAPERTIYSAGFPFDSKDIRITSGQVSQLSDIPFDNGTQIGYTISKGNKGIRQGMSGGAIIDERGKFIGINTLGTAPILPNYTYNDGSKPLAKLAAKYREANWGVPVYNFLVQVKPDILYGYKFNELKIGKIQRQATLTGYMAKLNDTARKQTVRIENSGSNGSGVIIAKEGDSYYVLTAKHVVEDPKTNRKFTNQQIVTYDQDRHSLTGTVIAENTDLAVIKFSTKSNYPIAQLNEHNPNNDELVFVGGFPDRQNINSPLWQWQLNPGFILDRESGKITTQNNLSFSNGYDLYYGNISYGGMSGGPVFDTDGRVIGIHGRAETTDRTILGGSLGISIQSFTGSLDKLQVKPGLLKVTQNNPTILNVRDRKTVIAAMNNISPPEAEADGKRWLAYGNQLTRTLQFDKAIVAFDKAITKGEVLEGNYGKTLSLLILRKFDLAKDSIGRAVALAPNDKNRANYYYFWKYQSRIFSRLGKYDEAIEAIDVAIKLEPKDQLLQLEKSDILNRNGKYAAAISICDELIRSQPTAPIYLNRALIKSKSGDVPGAIADVSQAIKINPNHKDGYISRGLFKSTSGDTNGGIVDINRAIKINPNSNVAYLARSIVYLQLNNFTNALADTDRASELSNVKGFSQAISSTREILSVTYTIRAGANLGLKNFQAALTDSDRAIETISSKLSTKEIAWTGVLATTYMIRGGAKIGLQKFKDAIADLDRAIDFSKAKDLSQSDRNKVLAPSLLYRGVAKALSQDTNGAIIDTTEAAKLFRQQGQMELYQQATSLLENLKKLPGTEKVQKGAISDFDRAIVINPQFAEAYINRGNAKYTLGNKQGAIGDYDKAISISPPYADTYNNRGAAKLALGDKQGAISDYDKAIAINPQYADRR